MTIDFERNEEFEDEVRRIARALWPQAQYQGSSVEDKQERDGVFITDEVVHLIECTTSRKKDKALEDIRKLDQLAKRMRKDHPMHVVKCWFVTRDEPTALQRNQAKRVDSHINVVSVRQFRDKLIQVSEYLSARADARRLIERLASKTRSSFDRVGIVTQEQIQQAFFEITERYPDDSVTQLLQRLPGLGAPNAEDGTRQFVDADLYDVAKSGDVVLFLQDPYNFDVPGSEAWSTTIGDTGIQVLAHRVSKLIPNASDKYMRAALEHLSSKRENLYPVIADVVAVVSHLDISYAGADIYVAGVYFEYMPLQDLGTDLSGIQYQDCIVDVLELLGGDSDSFPTFYKCHFVKVEGRSSERDLPKSKFMECTFEEFSSGSLTTSSILSMNISLSTRVLLTMLKKLYLQPGSGRLEVALRNGLDPKAQALVPDVLAVMEREGLAVLSRASSRRIWLPIRSQTARVKKLISAPSNSSDPVLDLLYPLD